MGSSLCIEVATFLGDEAETDDAASKLVTQLLCFTTGPGAVQRNVSQAAANYNSLVAFMENYMKVMFPNSADYPVEQSGRAGPKGNRHINY